MFSQFVKSVGGFVREHFPVLCSVLVFSLLGIYLVYQEREMPVKPDPLSTSHSILSEAGKEQKLVENTKETEDTKEQEEKQIDTSTQSTKPLFPIHLMGAVAKPGVYFIEEGWYLEKVITLAGGLLAEADAEKINLAALVEPYVKITIPFKGEGEKTMVFQQEQVMNSSQTIVEHTNKEEKEGAGIPSKKKKSALRSKNGIKININHASEAELQNIPGVGPKMAEQIIRFRQKRGRFKKLEDLLQVPGIKEGKFRKFKPYIII